MGTVGVAAIVSVDPLLAVAVGLPALLAIVVVYAVTRREGRDPDADRANVYAIEDARETRAGRGSSESPRWR